MGFAISFNTILRYEVTHQLAEGGEYPFEKAGLHLVGDDIQIWLPKNDWTALAEIQITSQTRMDGKTHGTFMVNHLYHDSEQQILTSIFRRMYGWK
jgi:hypothetical protein